MLLKLSLKLLPKSNHVYNPMNMVDFRCDNSFAALPWAKWHKSAKIMIYSGMIFSELGLAILIILWVFFNSLAPGTLMVFFGFFLNVIFNLALLIGIFKSSYANVLRRMPQDLTNDKSTLVQVMAWCREATSHYLNQCWPRSPMPYGITRPQWVNSLTYGIRYFGQHWFM